MSIPNVAILRSRPGSDHIVFRCDYNRQARSRSHPMYILDTPSRLRPNPILHVIGSTGNEYQIVVTTTSISCSCPDKHSACKHILSLVHQTFVSHRRGQTFYVQPSTLIQKIQSGVFLNFLTPLVNSLCISISLHAACCVCTLPLSGTVAICSKCPTAHHIQCNLLDSATCTSCHNPGHSLISTTTDNGYRNYSKIILHYGYRLRTPQRPPPQHHPRHQIRAPPPPLVFNQNLLPDQHPSAVIPPSPIRSDSNSRSV